jgi:hypothetical protein
MTGSPHIIRPATIGLGVVLSLFSTLESSRLVCALVGCCAYQAESGSFNGIHHDEKICCHSKANRLTRHAHREADLRDGLQTRVVPLESVRFPFKSCPCPDNCVCKANLGPSIPTQSVSIDAPTQPSMLSCVAGDCVSRAHNVRWYAEDSIGCLHASEFCVILCRFQA